MELKVGMYVRTKNGNIGRITFISPLDNLINLDTEDYSIGKHFIKKARYNIIDLIEVGDYVNGELVVAIHEHYVCDEIELGTALETACNYTATLNEDIKSIVTSQQFESMSYKVGD